MSCSKLFLYIGLLGGHSSTLPKNMDFCGVSWYFYFKDIHFEQMLYAMFLWSFGALPLCSVKLETSAKLAYDSRAEFRI